jgi:PAS domain S-box-containing protein
MRNFNKTADFYRALDLSIMPVIMLNEKNSCQYFNKAFLSQIGYTIEQVPDRITWFESAYPDKTYRCKVIESWYNCIEFAESNGDEIVHLVTRVCCADGSCKWYDVYESILSSIKMITFVDVDWSYNTN